MYASFWQEPLAFIVALCRKVSLYNDRCMVGLVKLSMAAAAVFSVYRTRPTSSVWLFIRACPFAQLRTCRVAAEISKAHLAKCQTLGFDMGAALLLISDPTPLMNRARSMSPGFPLFAFSVFIATYTLVVHLWWHLVNSAPL